MTAPAGTEDTHRLEISGSTLLIDILRHCPGGEAQSLMTRLAWPCGHCGGMTCEPLAMAAKRHRQNARKVIECFRALQTGGPTEAQIADALAVPKKPAQEPLVGRYAGFSLPTFK